MSYDCPDFYDDVCRAAGEHLGVQFTEHDGDEIDCDAESVVLAIARAAKERRELLSVLQEFVQDFLNIGADNIKAGWPDSDMLVTYKKARAAIAKVQS